MLDAPGPLPDRNPWPWRACVDACQPMCREFEAGRAQPTQCEAPRRGDVSAPRHGPAVSAGLGSPACQDRGPGGVPAGIQAPGGAPAGIQAPHAGTSTLRSLFMQPSPAAPPARADPPPTELAARPLDPRPPTAAAQPQAPACRPGNSAPEAAPPAPGERRLPASFLGGAVPAPGSAPSPCQALHPADNASLSLQQPSSWQAPAGLGPSSTSPSSSGAASGSGGSGGSGAGLGPLMYASMELGADRSLELWIGYHDAVSAVLKR